MNNHDLVKLLLLLEFNIIVPTSAVLFYCFAAISSLKSRIAHLERRVCVNDQPGPPTT